MSKYFALDKGIDYLTGKVIVLSAGLALISLCAGMYHSFLGLQQYVSTGQYTEQLGKGLAFLVMAFAQIPSWLMAQSKRSRLSKGMSLVVWTLINLFCLVVHMVLRR